MAGGQCFTDFKSTIQNLPIKHFKLILFFCRIQKIGVVECLNKMCIILFFGYIPRNQSISKLFYFTYMFGYLQFNIQSDKYSYLLTL